MNRLQGSVNGVLRIEAFYERMRERPQFASAEAGISPLTFH